MSRSGSAHPTTDTISYSYNDRSEVIGALSNVDASYTYAYVYDPIGNRISASEAGAPWTYTTNNLNQYTSATEDNAQLNFTYDLDGSMTYRPVDAATGWTQVWNGENRMVDTYKGDARLTFQYDYMGRRVEKKVYDGQTLATHLKFVYDGFKLIEELDGLSSDAPLRRYTWQPDDVGLDVVLQMSDVPNAAHSFHLHDANKNVMQKTNSNGAFQENYGYTPFGLTLASIPAYIGFSSEVFDSMIGLNYYNYRYYCPFFIGRWNGRDPIGENSSLNLHLFSLNSPVNVLDFLGLDLIDLNDGFPGFSDIPGAPNPYFPIISSPAPRHSSYGGRIYLTHETITLSIRAAIQEEINDAKNNLNIQTKGMALAKCKNNCEPTSETAKIYGHPFRTYTQMYWSKYSPWYIGNIVVGQVVIKCKLNSISTCNCKTKKCLSSSSGYCYYSDKFDFNLLLFTLDTYISYIGFWEE